MFGKNKEAGPQKLIFETINDKGGGMGVVISRAKVPNGWLVSTIGGGGGGITFMPDPDHSWEVKTT